MDSFKDISEVINTKLQNSTEAIQEQDTDFEEFVPNHVFTDQDREKAVQVRKAQADSRLLKIQQDNEIARFEHLLKMEQLRTQAIELRMQRQELRESMNTPPVNNDEDSLLGNLIEMVKIGMQQRQIPQAQPIPQPVAVSPITPTATGDITDEEIEAYYNKVPKFLIEKAKLDSDDNLRAQLIQFKPDLTANGVKRIIARIRK